MKKVFWAMLVVGLVFSFTLAVTNEAVAQSSVVTEVLKDLNQRGAPTRIYAEGQNSSETFSLLGGVLPKELGSDTVKLPYVDFWQYASGNQWALDFYISFDFPETKLEVFWEEKRVVTRTPAGYKLNKKNTGATLRVEAWHSIMEELNFDGQNRFGIVEVAVYRKSGRPFSFYQEVVIPDFYFWLSDVQCASSGYLTLVYAIQPLYDLKLVEGTWAEVFINNSVSGWQGSYVYLENGMMFLKVTIPTEDLKNIVDGQKDEGTYTTLTIGGLSYGRSVYYWYPYWMACEVTNPAVGGGGGSLNP